MPASQITFTGINRSVSDYALSGACEELINMRPTSSGMTPIRPKAILFDGDNYDAVYTHNISGDIIYILRKEEEDTVIFSARKKDGTVITDELISYTDVPESSIHVAMLGNMVTISVCDDSGAHYSNDVFRWDGEGYTSVQADIPTISTSFTIGEIELKHFYGEGFEYTDPKAKIADIIQTGFNAIEQNNPEYCFGAILLALAFKTNDGETFWTNQWYYIDPVPWIKNASLHNDYFYTHPFWVGEENRADIVDDFVSAGLNPFKLFIPCLHLSSEASKVALGGMQLSISLSQVTDWVKDTSMIKSVEIYTSRPDIYINTDKITITNEEMLHERIFVEEKSRNEMNLGSKLLYLNKSIPLVELAKSQQTISLSFGGDVQTQHTDLKVDAGAKVRFGDIISFNSRLHYFASTSKTIIGEPDFGCRVTAYSNVSTFSLNILVDGEEGEYEDINSAITSINSTFPPNSPQITTSNGIALTKTYSTWTHVFSKKCFRNTDTDKYRYSTLRNEEPGENEVLAYYSYIFSSSITTEQSISYKPCHAVATYLSSKGKQKINLGEVRVCDDLSNLIAIVPSSNISELGLYYNTSGTSYKYMVLSMSDSSSYNFSINDKGNAQWVLGDSSTPAIAEMLEASEINYVMEKETSDINVTEQYNPFVFNVQQSYRIPGTITGIQAQLQPINEVTYGQYPLAVFTDVGVFSMQQGSGDVLYSNVLPVSNMVSISNAASTDYGIFFIAKDGVYLLSGRQAVLVSEALSKGPHLFLKTNIGYNNLCRNQNLYDVEHYESVVPIEYFVDGASLSYDKFHHELIVSNPEYKYSYVLSVIYKQWYKMSYVLSQAIAGDNVAISIVNENTRVIDISLNEDPDYYLNYNGDVLTWDGNNILSNDKVKVLVHVESRPFSPAMLGYSHIRRVVEMVRANLVHASGDTNATKNLTVALYGSDDLQEWRTLSYAQRTNVKLSQIRTPKAPRSYRYYKVTIGGIVPTETDFGQMLIDWEPVIRRLG